ncbi:uncharacterized protein LOC135390081 isoform X2 [Ornithodoros turicata]|uniref:uncharacterized protein LOC135390081 isoform X2 n=1 Tax=Ornithodoros turicata TaxID=34597 RepID=UPI00313878B7
MCLSRRYHVYRIIRQPFLLCAALAPKAEETVSSLLLPLRQIVETALTASVFKMTHILLKWTTAEAWDVYPTRKMTATEIMNDPSIVESLVGRTFEITWKSGEPPAKAHLIAAGDLGNLERRRNRLAARACKNMSQASGCCGHEEQIKQLQQANDDLKRNIEDLENMMGIQECITICWFSLTVLHISDSPDIQKTVKTLERIVRKMKASQEERPVLEPNQVDPGSGVYVSSATLTRLQESYKDSPSKFARALTRVLFTDEELKNRSLFGKQANSHKNKDPRPVLDENRVTEHTCVTFKCADYLVKRSLGAMLHKLNKGTP